MISTLAPDSRRKSNDFEMVLQLSNHRLPKEFFLAMRHQGIRPTRFVLAASVAGQTMRLFETIEDQGRSSGLPPYVLRKRYLISSSAWGVGQTENSNRTPLGLHRVAEKIGGGQPIGTVFRSRQPAGLTWQGRPNAAIVHRILWLGGLEPGHNRGGNVDTYRRYIYIHGFGDETTLGQPNSHGCLHMAAADLMPLFDHLAVGTLVWIEQR